jgi:hypothetical protein
MGISIPIDSRLGRSAPLRAARLLHPGCLSGARFLPACTACLRFQESGGLHRSSGEHGRNARRNRHPDTGPEPSRREQSECAPSPSTSLGVNSAEWSHACPFPHESPIALALSAANVAHSPLLFANRGYPELAMAPSLCKQRATLLSNRGKIRVVQPLRHRSTPGLIATRTYSRDEPTH